MMIGVFCFHSVTQLYSEKQNPNRNLPAGVESVTFQLLVWMLYHRATGDLRELRPLNWVHGKI